MKQRTITILYWIFTILFCAFMLFSGVSELFHLGGADKVINDLGYPTYFNDILGIAKILGVVAILQIKWITIKEWAYAGFAIDIIGAILSIIFSGGGVLMTIIQMLPFIIVFSLAYYFWKKKLR